MIFQKTYRIGVVLTLVALLIYTSGVRDLMHHVSHLLEEEHPVCTASDGTDHLHSEEYAGHSCVLCTISTLNFHTDEEVSLKELVPFLNVVSFSYTAPIFKENRFLLFLRGPPYLSLIK